MTISRGLILSFAVACATAPTEPAGLSEIPYPPTGPVQAEAGQVVDASSERTQPEPDASDAAVLDPASQQILAVRAASASLVDGGALNLTIAGAVVTYVRPAVGTDPAGFFIQAEKSGPALFVAVDPNLLSPVPVPGDEVSFRVTSAVNLSGMRHVTSIDMFTRTAQGRDRAALLQDVSMASDLAANPDKYESEYVMLGGTVAAPLAAAGTDSVAAQITTTGVTVASSNLRARFPSALADTLDVAPGCTFTLTGPMWRFATASQPSAFAAADVSKLVCNAPRVVAASSLSSTTVTVTFDRKLDPASLLANGSQFTLTGGLLVSAATLSGPREVTLTTSMQAPASPYIVSCLATLLDKAGKGVDPANNVANFAGYDEPAILRIEELNPAIGGSSDLIELRALSAGNLVGTKLEENLVNNKKLIATLPMLRVLAGDLIVIHLNPAGITDEIATQTDCIAATCHPGAWDVKGMSDLSNNARALVIRGKNLALMDGVAYFNSSLMPSSTWFTEVNALSTAMQWSDCGGAACIDNMAAFVIGADFRGVATIKSGASLRRLPVADSNGPADWSVGPSSWGVANP